ncbi:alpha/beta fold hydrolase [Salana multivorans]
MRRSARTAGCSRSWRTSAAAERPSPVPSSSSPLPDPALPRRLRPLPAPSSTRTSAEFDPYQRRVRPVRPVQLDPRRPVRGTLDRVTTLESLHHPGRLVGPLWAVAVGHGPPLVLLHGNAESHRVFDRLVPLLAPRMTLVGLDSRGHGRSPRGTGEAPDLAHGRRRRRRHGRARPGRGTDPGFQRRRQHRPRPRSTPPGPGRPAHRRRRQSRPLRAHPSHEAHDGPRARGLPVCLPVRSRTRVARRAPCAHGHGPGHRPRRAPGRHAAGAGRRGGAGRHPARAHRPHRGCAAGRRAAPHPARRPHDPDRRGTPSWRLPSRDSCAGQIGPRDLWQACTRPGEHRADGEARW